jgi:hypothetical protein
VPGRLAGKKRIGNAQMRRLQSLREQICDWGTAVQPLITRRSRAGLELGANSTDPRRRARAAHTWCRLLASKITSSGRSHPFRATGRSAASQFTSWRPSNCCAVCASQTDSRRRSGPRSRTRGDTAKRTSRANKRAHCRPRVVSRRDASGGSEGSAVRIQDRVGTCMARYPARWPD